MTTFPHTALKNWNPYFWFEGTLRVFSSRLNTITKQIDSISIMLVNSIYGNSYSSVSSDMNFRPHNRWDWKFFSNSGLHPTPQEPYGADSAEIQSNQITIRIGRLQLYWNFPCNAGRHKLSALKLCLAYLQKKRTDRERMGRVS